MQTSTVTIHVLSHGRSAETLESITESALDLGFPTVHVDETMTDDDHVMLTTTLRYDQDSHENDTAVRTAVENVLSSASLHVMSTETEYASDTPAPRRHSPSA